MQETLLVSCWLTFQIVHGAPAISIETPSKEHMDHFLIQKQLKQEMSSEECYFDNGTWARVIEERKQEMRWEKRVEAYKAGLITTGLFVAEADKKTHWTDRYSGFWFPHNFRRRRSAIDTAVADLADQYRVLEVLRNTRPEGAKRSRRSNVEDGEKMLDQQPAKSNPRVRRKRALAVARANRNLPRLRRHLVERLRRSLLVRHKRHLSENERDILDPYAFKAKDYNYYDYNNMLTAVTLASSTIKFVEKAKRDKEDVAQANDVHEFNRKHKNVFGGFHNDSEMLTFLRNYHYKNYTHEERKMAYFDDFMLRRVNERVEFFKKNLVSYKKHYRSFRERSNKEGHRYVDPDTEDQSAIIPDFDAHGILNYTELYKYFRWACEHADYKSAEVEPEPENHYMPPDHTDSSGDQVYRSGQVEAMQSDYEAGRINTSCWTKYRRRRLASPPRDIRIDIKVINKFYPDHIRNDRRDVENSGGDVGCDGNRKKNGERKNIGKHNGDFVRDNYKTVNSIREKEKKIGERFTAESDGGNGDVDSRKTNDEKGQNVNRIDIMFQMNQNNGQKHERQAENYAVGAGSNQNFNSLSKVLDLMKNKVCMNVVGGLLSNLEQSMLREQNGGIGGVFDMIANIVNGYERNSHAKSLKVFEIFEIQIDSPSKKQSRTKRSVGGQKYLALNKVVKTVDNNDDFVLHLYLTPTDTTGALIQSTNQNHLRSKRNVAANAIKPEDDKRNEDVEEPEDPNLCPLMKRVFYWKDIRDKNKDVVMSHEASIDAVSMDDWNKRRDRHIKGITTKEELLEKIENEKEAAIKAEEERLVQERQNREAAKNAPADQEPTDDPNECPLMQKVFYWKRVRDQNNVEMSHEASIDAVSMDDWHKRRDRHIAGYTKPGEDSRPLYEDAIKGKHIDPRKDEKLRRKRRENSEEVKGFQDPAETAAHEAFQGCPLTFEPPKPNEEPKQACPLTFDPPKEDKPVQACPITFEAPQPPKDEPVQGCPLTFEPPKAEEPIKGCPFTFGNPKVSKEGELSDSKQEQSVKASGNSPSAFQHKSDDREEKQPWGGFSEFPAKSKAERSTPVAEFRNPDNWSTRFPPQYKPIGYSPFIVSRSHTRQTYNQRTFEINPVTKVSEPKFVRVIYNGIGYVRHVHFITNREFQKKKFVREYHGVKNVYVENFLLERNQTVKKIALANHKVPRMIQNHYFDEMFNRTRYINLYYDSEGDLTYTTRENNLRVPITYRGMTNKHTYRSYYCQGMSRRTLTRLKEPVLVQLHYSF